MVTHRALLIIYIRSDADFNRARIACHHSPPASAGRAPVRPMRCLTPYPRGGVRRQPSRIAFCLSGLIMVVIALGIGLVLVVVLGTVEGAIIGSVNHVSAAAPPAGTDSTVVVIKMFLAAMYAGAFYVVLAYAAGSVFRSSPAGVGIGIGFAVAQTVARGIFTALGDPWASIASHFPDSYSTALTSRIGNELLVGGPMGSTASDAVGVPIAILGLTVYIAVLLAVTLTVIQTRDVSS